MSNQSKFTESETAFAVQKLAEASMGILSSALVRVVSQMNVSIEVAGKVLGISRSTALRYLKYFEAMAQRGEEQESRHGGRRSELLSPEEEVRFLETFRASAQKGELVTVAPLVSALEQKLGREISDVNIYNMLKRNKWRKLMPDTRHPKNDPAAAEAFKKNYQKSWLPPKSEPKS